MVTPPSDAAPSIPALASACARHLAPGSTTFADDAVFRSQFSALLGAVAASGERYGFDRENRPGALQAVRRALPALEVELFDLILEDLACELAATQEALYQVARAATSPDRRSEGP